MYNSPYTNVYNPQATVDKINAQMNELEKMKQQLQHPIQQTPTNLTQNFQISPNNRDVIKYANSIEEVQRDMVIGDTPFFSKDMSVVWVKNTKNEIKTYELNEIIPKDEKDIQIEFLQAQIEELKGMMTNEQSTSNANAEQVATDTTEHGETVGESIEKSKSTGISRISKSKKG